MFMPIPLALLLAATGANPRLQSPRHHARRAGQKALEEALLRLEGLPAAPKGASWWLTARSTCALCIHAETLQIWRDLKGEWWASIQTPFLVGGADQVRALNRAHPDWRASRLLSSMVQFKLEPSESVQLRSSIQEAASRLSRIQVPLCPIDPTKGQSVVDGEFVFIESGGNGSRTVRWESGPQGHEELARWVRDFHQARLEAWLSMQREQGYPALLNAVEFKALASEFFVAACGEGSEPKLVDVLLGRGMSGHIRNLDGDWALAAAAERGDVDLVRRLLTHGADPKAPGRDGWMALDAAINSRSPETVKALLDGGAPVDRSGHGDGLPLARARRYGLKEIEVLLLSAGAR